MKIGKCSEATLAPEPWVWNKPPPSQQKCCLGNSGVAGVPDYQAASKVTHLNCWNQYLPTSAAGFTQTRLTAGAGEEAAWPDMQTEWIIILVFSSGFQDTSFCCSFKNLDAWLPFCQGLIAPYSCHLHLFWTPPPVVGNVQLVQPSTASTFGCWQHTITQWSQWILLLTVFPSFFTVPKQRYHTSTCDLTY